MLPSPKVRVDTLGLSCSSSTALDLLPMFPHHTKSDSITLESFMSSCITNSPPLFKTLHHLPVKTDNIRSHMAGTDQVADCKR